MSNTVIRIENLSKSYILNHQKERVKYKALRDVLADGVKSLSRKFFNFAGEQDLNYIQEQFWALNDVSFELKQGERVGIIGRNGAGKSTLLKLLSRITEPTKGRIQLKGRVASLLEVGTGFHPELTGRENIYLNGAILGMSRAEIKQKFDEIVSFAEVEKFLDTPVKRYSSGMYVRLAFAVAAHLESEILIIDEVLAVGDAQFQNKCLGKMEDIGKEGRTVIFVSHNMAVVRQLCNSAVLLHQGKLVLQDLTESVLTKYLSMNESTSSINIISKYGLQLIDIFLEDEQNSHITNSPIFNSSYSLKVRLKSLHPFRNVAVVIRIYDAMNALVSTICSPEEGAAPFAVEKNVEISFSLPQIQLFPGVYKASVFVYRPNDPIAYLEAENCFSFEIQPAIVHNSVCAYRRDHGITRISGGCQVYSL